MAIEARPHIRETTRYLKSGETVVEKSSECPEDVDPYGEVPVEVEFLKPMIEELRAFFLKGEGDEGWAKGRPSPEGIVDIIAGKDDAGRKTLIIAIWHEQPTVQEDEALRRQIQRYYLYPNNVGTYQFLEHVFREFRDEYQKVVHVNEETVLSQGFMSEIHLENLKYAKMVLERNP